MEIPRSLLNELTEAVNALSASAQALAATALDEILKEWDGEDVAGLRVKCIEALEAIESAYCDAFAAGRAAEFYEGCRAAQGVRGGYSAVADSRRDPQALAGAVRAMVQYAADGDTDRYRRECLSRIDADIRRSANSCVAYNVRRDPKKPKYARVPSGSETCGFCLMLASFGFRYTTEEAAGHAHTNCDCRVVPNFGKASVEGYSADGMYSRYQDVLETLGGRDGIRAEWDALPTTKARALVEIRKDIESSYQIVRTAVEDLLMRGIFSLENLNNRLKRAGGDTLNIAFEGKIAEMKAQERIGNMMAYRVVMKGIERFAGPRVPLSGVSVD